jgi:Tfp pilus assembly protein PilF
VIARNTAFTFKGKAVNVKQVGRELNVRYVLEGSVQRGGNRLRVNVQLIDVETGNHLWAERFEKPVADLFDMQDEIVSRLANTLNAELIEVEARRAGLSTHPDAMDLYFQGWACTNNGTTAEYMTQAQAFFDRALALDPDNIEALVGSARVEAAIGANLITDDWKAHLAAAEAASTKALSLAPNHARAQSVLGLVNSFSNPVQAIAECERALALDHNLADAHAFIGLAKFFLGRSEETEAHIREALRLSPRDTNAYRWFMFVGLAKLFLGADVEAVAWLRRSITISPLHCRCSAHRTRRGPPHRRALCSILPSPSAATEPAWRATIWLISPDASVCMRACAWPGCRRDERQEVGSQRHLTRRHSLECLQRGIHRVPGMAADAVRDQLRIELAWVVKAGGVNRYQLRHGDECQVDWRSAGRAEGVVLFVPAVAGYPPVFRFTRNAHVGAPGED